MGGNTCKIPFSLGGVSNYFCTSMYQCDAGDGLLSNCILGSFLRVRQITSTSPFNIAFTTISGYSVANQGPHKLSLWTFIYCPIASCALALDTIAIKVGKSPSVSDLKLVYIRHSYRDIQWVKGEVLFNISDSQIFVN